MNVARCSGGSIATFFFAYLVVVHIVYIGSSQACESALLCTETSG